MEVPLWKSKREAPAEISHETEEKIAKQVIFCLQEKFPRQGCATTLAKVVSHNPRNEASITPDVVLTVIEKMVKRGELRQLFYVALPERN